MEGINHEAVGLAGHLQLGRLIVLWDDNNITIDGSTDLSRNEDVIARHQAARLAHRANATGSIPATSTARSTRRSPTRGRPDPLQDDHRLWRAQQAGHGRDPRRRARRGRGRGGARSSSAGTGRRSKSRTMC